MDNKEIMDNENIPENLKDFLCDVMRLTGQNFNNLAAHIVEDVLMCRISENQDVGEDYSITIDVFAGWDMERDDCVTKSFNLLELLDTIYGEGVYKGFSEHLLKMINANKQREINKTLEEEHIESGFNWDAKKEKWVNWNESTKTWGE